MAKGVKTGSVASYRAGFEGRSTGGQEPEMERERGTLLRMRFEVERGRGMKARGVFWLVNPRFLGV